MLMKKISTLLLLFTVTLTLSAQVIWEGSFEQSEGWATVGTSVSGQKDFVANGLTTDTFWNLVFSTGTVKDYTTTITSEANTGSQALLISLTTTSGECKLRSNAQSLVEGESYNVTYSAKTDAAGVALGGALIGGVKDSWNTLTTSYQTFTDVISLQGTLRFFIYFPDATAAGFNVYIDDVKIEKASTSPVETQAEDIAFDVYPNPVTDYLYFKSDLNLNSAEVYNLAGQKVLHAENGAVGIDVGELSEGIYLLSADVDGRKVTRRFTKR